MADGNLEPRVAVLEQIALDTQRALDRMERRFDGLETRLETRFGALERRIEALDKREHTNFLWLLAIMLGGYASMFATMAHGFKWI